MRGVINLKLLFDIAHPADVHFFKNLIFNLQKNGHSILVTARNKDVSIDLLNAYLIDYIPVGRIGKSKINLIGEWIKRDYEILRIAHKFNPDVLLGFGPCSIHSAKVLKKISIFFDDSEVDSTGFLSYPFANVIFTPCNFSKTLGKKQIRFDGYKELAYLHPNYFSPKSEIYDNLRLDIKDKYIVMRFVAWKACHDLNQSGLNLETKLKFVRELNKYAIVYISSESELPPELDVYKITLPPEKMHDLLHYAYMLIGDSQTMTTEAAVLGTPAVRCNSFVGINDMSNFIELEKKYNLIFNYNDPNKALEKAIELIQIEDLKNQWRIKKDDLLKDKIDVTGFMTWFIENFPNSLKVINDNSQFQYQFR